MEGGLSKLYDLMQGLVIVQAQHGDIRPLVALLRSDELMCREVRDYLADELENEPKKRFSRKNKKDFSVGKNDFAILKSIYHAKRILFFESLPKDMTISDRVDCVVSQVGNLDAVVSDAAALDWMAIQGEQITASQLDNAKRRNKDPFTRMMAANPYFSQ